MSFEVNEAHLRVGQALVAEGTIDDSSLQRAIRVAAHQSAPLPDILCKLGLISESGLAEATARTLGYAIAATEDIPDSPIDIEGLSPRFLRQHRILPVGRTPDGYSVLIVDPADDFALDAFRLAAGKISEIRVAAPDIIERAIGRLYQDQLEDQASARDLGLPDEVEEIDVERLRDLASDAPVVHYVNGLIATAFEIRASDIHLEPFENELRLRYRIDGVLQRGDPVPDAFRAAVVSRLKIMARLDIAERRLPQDGRVKTVVRGNQIDLRIATLPTMFGESVVMRVLDRSSISLDYASLGIVSPALDVLQKIQAAPYGILLVTGPTGSGKTTTLYSVMMAINDPSRNLMTVEDPVEYQINGVNQVQVRPEIGLSFAEVLRSMLRHDPDVIMVGEIRDGETARIAAQAALTGHLVLSTLHTNDAPGAVTRLMDMGVEPYLLTSTLSGVVAQRLVRRLCRECREPYVASAELTRSLGIAEGPVTFHGAVGCAACRNTGYSGRTVIMEAFEMTEELHSLILRNAGTAAIRREAKASGMQSMFADGLKKAMSGETTIDEILGATRAD